MMSVQLLRILKNFCFRNYKDAFFQDADRINLGVMLIRLMICQDILWSAF